MKMMFKEHDELKIINYIFDLFTKFSKEGNMNNKQLKDVFEVF